MGLGLVFFFGGCLAVGGLFWFSSVRFCLGGFLGGVLSFWLGGGLWELVFV